jgi:Tfp pilus assembly protein PilZ
MKKYTSKFLKAIAIIYMFFPIFYMSTITVIFDIPMKVWLGVLMRPYFYIMALFCVLTGYALWEMKRWSWHLFVGINLLISYETAHFVYENAQNSNKVLAFFGLIGGLAFVVYQIGAEIKVPYFFPKIRWWESDPRYRLAVPSRIASDSKTTEGTILDLSMGGCFVRIKDPVSLNENILVQFEVFGISVDCEGTIVWVTESSVTHPKGIGIKFMRLGRAHRKQLKSITQRLKKIAAYYRRSRHFLTPEEFDKGVKEIENQGTG